MTRIHFRSIAALALLLGAGAVQADSTQARCDIYPKDQDQTDAMLSCTFSQRQGYISITREDGVTHELEPVDEDNPTAPFSTDDYDATALFRCRAAGDTEFGQCPGGVLRVEDGQASVVLQNQLGEQFTINFMKDYLNATNREAKAQLEGNTWIVVMNGKEVYEVPLAAIEGG
jgi:hypothetical protein